MGPEQFLAYKRQAAENRKGQKRSEETKEKMRLARERRRARELKTT
jgi:hypothetical protein